MHLIPFGKTNLKTTPIGLGLAALGRPGYINLEHGKDLNRNYEVSKMEQNAHIVMDTAYDKGVRYFDTARSYGKAEQFLGNWISDKIDLMIGSKWGYTYTAEWKVNADKHEVKQHTIEVLRRQWDESLQNLSGKIDIYHIHSATLESGVLENKKVLEFLWKLKESGIVVGLSLSGVGQSLTLEKSFNIKNEKGDLLFQSVQATWNILEQSATQSLQKASDLGYGVIIKEAVANGRLTAKNYEPSFSKKKLQLEQIASKHKVGIDAIAFSYALNQPWASIVLSGATNQSQFLENLRSIDVDLASTEVELLALMKEDSDQYWKTRSELSWN